MKLKKGDTIGIIALSGECDKEKINKAKSALENMGFKIKLSKNIFDQDKYLAGSDEVKTEELHSFFKDPNIKLILCARGGYGAIRLVNKINYELIKNNPKPFCGYSDVTALLLMIYKKTGMITYHSPMAYDFISQNNSKTISNFFKVINSNSIEYKAKEVLYRGVAKGILWGGNLATTVSLCGMDFLPKKDFVFFAEDISEPVYKIDKMFQQLLNIDRFRKYCKGVILGDFTDVDNEKWLREYYKELTQKLNIPAIHVEGITHNQDKITLPIGTKAKISEDILAID